MPDNIDPKLVDRRVVSRYLKKSRLDEKDYERYLKSLPDLAEQAVPIEAALDGDFDDDDQLDQEPAVAPEEPQPQPQP